MVLASYRPSWWLALALLLSSSLRAAETVHLLGFVDQLCPEEPYCFELLVEPDFVTQVGQHVRVRFDATTNIYDPENYELTLEQQNIIPGSHLRMLIEMDASRPRGDYRATFIWIGD